MLDREPPAVDLVLAGDVCYDREMTERVLPFLDRARAGGCEVLVGDPGRGYLPERLFVRRAEYPVPVPAALEETETLVTGVWQMLSPRNKL